MFFRQDIHEPVHIHPFGVGFLLRAHRRFPSVTSGYSRLSPSGTFPLASFGEIRRESPRGWASNAVPCRRKAHNIGHCAALPYSGQIAFLEDHARLPQERPQFVLK